MKITYVLPVYWPAIGGCELHTHELVKRLSERHEIKVITLINNQEDKLAYDPWVGCILKAPTEAVEYADNKAKVIKLSLKPIDKLRNLPLARIQSPKLPNVITEFLMERLAGFYMEKIDDLIKGSDVLHCISGGISYLGYASFMAAKKLGMPFIYTPVLHLYHKNSLNGKRDRDRSEAVDGFDLFYISKPRGWTDNYWFEVCRKSDALITLTDFEKKFFIKKGISGNKIYTVGIGPLISENSNGDIRQLYGIGDKKIVLFLGRNVAYKGIEEILLAARLIWKKYPETYFFFAGPQELDSEGIFKRYIDPRIKVLGKVTDENKSALLKACDVFCMPSTEESLGGSFLEAWMFGKPVIGGRTPQMIELTDNEKSGFVVNQDPEEIADKLSVLFQNQELGHRMGQLGKKKVLENYSWDVITARMESIYDGLCVKNAHIS